MSNTSRISPYDSRSTSAETSSGAVAAGLIGAALITAAAIKWLREETPRDKLAIDAYREERRRERLQDSRSGAGIIERVPLHVRDMEALIHSSENLGYCPQKPSPLFGNSSREDLVLLGKPSGERLAIRRNREGRLEVNTPHGRDAVKELVRRYTVDLTLDHLARKGMHVRMATLGTGDVQILAHESAGKHPDGAAAVKAQVCADGNMWVDVDNVHGRRCEAIVSELAVALESKIVSTRKKNANYQLPGEPTKTLLRI